MGKVSAIVDTTRLSIGIPIRPDLFDHRFEDRPVYPAVEAMETLAGAVRTRWPEAAVEHLADIRFERFLPVAEDTAEIPVLCDLCRGKSGDIAAEMLSRIRFRSGITRYKVHASALFVQDSGHGSAKAAKPDPVKKPGFQVPANRLYRELVPFGPGFQTLVEAVELFKNAAIAAACCPEHRPEPGRLLGSSFLLDGAFHAACAWGQRFTGIVAFPVSIDRRQVFLPTQRGERYSIRAVPTRIDSELLVFAIDITDEAGRLRERAEGVHMRDVSDGRLQPPEWVQEKI